MKRIMSVVLMLTLVITMVTPCNVEAKQRKFTKSQQYYADRIAKVVSDNWNKYGVLPSVAVAQAFIESTLGDHCSGYNLWGIRSGEERYDSLDDGIYRYMNVINNGYYDGAPFCKDYEKQIRLILDGGYCTPEGTYYDDVLWTIEEYRLYEYDNKMFDTIKKKKQQKLQKQKKEQENISRPYEPFIAHNDKSIDKYVVYANAETISGGCVQVYCDNKYVGTYDVVCDNTIYGNNIKINNNKLDGKKIYMAVFENAVG